MDQHARPSVADALTRLAERLNEAVGAVVELERPADPAHGDYATNVALRLAGHGSGSRASSLPSSPAAAERLDGVERAEVAGPGLRQPDARGRVVRHGRGEILADPHWAAGSASTPERVQVELVSANPTGPVTVGSARNAAYGDSVARLLELAGPRRRTRVLLQRRRAPGGLFRASVEAVRRGEDPPGGRVPRAYIRASRARGRPVAR